MLAGNWRLRTSPARATLTTRSVRHRYDDGREPPSSWPSRSTPLAGRRWGPGRAAGALVKGLTDDRPVELMAARPGAGYGSRRTIPNARLATARIKAGMSVRPWFMASPTLMNRPHFLGAPSFLNENRPLTLVVLKP